MQSSTAPKPARAETAKSRRTSIVRILLAIVFVVAVFAFALPRFADLSQVWDVIVDLTWIEATALLVLALWNIATYWLVMMASLPGSNVWQCMKVNQASTAVANTVPGGGAVALGVTYGMFSQYGFSRDQIALYVLVSGIWNNFVKLGMPVLALALLALQGEVDAARVTAGVAGVLMLALSIVLFALILRSERLARRIGEGLGRVVSMVKRWMHRGPAGDWGGGAVGFRAETKELVSKRWLWLTSSSVVSHLSLYLVLLVCLRNVGVAEAQVSWVQALAAFAFIRLLSALPITPGGLGVVELGLTAALVAYGGEEAAVLAGVLLYRALTYALPIPLGLLAYLRWQRGSAARKLRVAGEQPVLAGTGEGQAGR